MRKSLWLITAVASLLAAGCSSFRAEADFELTAAWTNFERIVVQPRSGSVTLRAEASPGGEVAVSGKRFATAASLEEARENVDAFAVVAAPDPADPATLLVTLEIAGGRDIRNIGANVNIRIPVPAEARISTANGAVSVERMNRAAVTTSNGAITAAMISGDAELRSSNGQIRATDVTGGLTADSSNGVIVAERIGGTCRLETSNGRIEAREISGIEAVSSNGSIAVVARPRADESIALRTSNGSISIRVPESIQGTLDLTTSNGSIDTKLGPVKLTNASWARTRVRAEMNGGGAGGIRATSSNGSIRVECGGGEASTAAEAQPLQKHD